MKKIKMCQRKIGCKGIIYMYTSDIIVLLLLWGPIKEYSSNVKKKGYE